MIGITTNVETTDGAGERVKEGVREGLLDAAQAGFAESQRLVPVASGDLKASGELIRGETEVGFQYDSEYAQFVEGGTEPHWPPIEPLKEWAEIVLGDRQAAYAVQQQIAEEGTPAQEFMRPGFQRMASELQRRGLSPSIEGQL
jgi:hypothetical protein